MTDDPDDELDDEIVDDDTSDEEEGGPFICPECGGGEARQRLMVSSDPVPGDPWSEILQILKCDGCGSRIPAHLGERWGAMSVEDAQAEWRATYRRRQPRW